MNAGIREETGLPPFGDVLQVRFKYNSNFVGTANSMVWRSGSSIYRVSATKIFLDFATILRKSQNQTYGTGHCRWFSGVVAFGLEETVEGHLGRPRTAPAVGGLSTFDEFVMLAGAHAVLEKRTEVV